MTVYLTLDDITDLAEAVLALEGEELLTRDPGLLQSALARPQSTVFGEDAYPSLARKAAALLESLVRNHALIDGNKRIAWAAAKLFLFYNDVHLIAPGAEQGETFMLAVAQGQLDIDEVAHKIAMWSFLDPS